MHDANEIHRRQFANQLAQAVLAASASAAVLSPAQVANGQTTPETTDATRPENVLRANDDLPQELALLNILMQRYPSDHYDRTVIRGIYSDLRGDLARGQILGQFPLMNSDEPSYVFRAYRAKD